MITAEKHSWGSLAGTHNAKVADRRATMATHSKAPNVTNKCCASTIASEDHQRMNLLHSQFGNSPAETSINEKNKSGDRVN
jgi:hypothetical protein